MVKRPGNARWFSAVFSLAALFCAFSPQAGVFAQVNREELSRNQGPVYFVNYEGPQARTETRLQIRNIGYGLGTAARGGAVQAGGTDRYFVIHSVSPADGDRLDADIFGLGIDVGVDHIRNLRLIIQGYLEGAYGYNESDAALLAEYVTIYNAVYRGDWDYFSSRYKNAVSAYLTREKAGLSTRYDQWPGQALMLIPLGPGGAGSLSAINTSSLIEGKVTEELRKEDDQGVPQRQAMVDLLERESDEAGQRAEDQKAAIVQEEAAIAQERRDNAAERQQIAQERQQVQADAEAGKVTQEEAQKAEEELAAREEAAEQKEEALDRREEAAAEQKEEAQKAEEFAEQKAQEAQQQRQEIAADQQAQIVKTDAAPPGEGVPAGVLAAVMNGPASPLGWLLQVNPSNGAELKRSLLNTVNPRTLYFMGARLLAVAGENRGSGAIRLVEISPDTLEMLRQGEDDISPGSLLWVNGADLYAISSSGGNLYLARFSGDDLSRQARSAVQVHPYATVSFQGDLLLTQRTDGSALALNPKDLTEKK